MPDNELIIEDMKPQHRVPLKSKAQIKALAEDIHANGLKHPVVVDEATGAVIDGLARIAAYKIIGHARIPAVISTSIIDLAETLAKARMDAYDDGMPPPARQVELVADTRGPKDVYLLSTRRRPMTLRRSDPAQSTGGLMLLATGLRPAVVEILWNAKSRADGGDVAAAQSIKEFIAMKIGVYSIRNDVLSSEKAALNADMPAAEKLLVFSNGLKQLITISEQIERVGPLKGLSLEKRRELYQMLARHRRQYNHISALIGYSIKNDPGRGSK